jgi:type III pantothenate kinase
MEISQKSRVVIDIGNTHIHVGRHENGTWSKLDEIPTQPLLQGRLDLLESIWSPDSKPDWAAFCSVVPKASEKVRAWLQSQELPRGFCELNHRTVTGIGIDYPKPESIGPDRLANAMAASHHYGTPSVVVDFGTAVTFDVLNLHGDYVGGIIAPGVSVMTDYLHEKTALLPRIEIKDPGSVIGKNTEQAMQIGAVYGYRGLIRQLIEGLKQELGTTQIPVIATGGYAELIAGGLDCITEVRPHLTLEGLLLLDPAKG